jgi:hypothetical protein
MSADSWQAFANALAEENRTLGEVGSAALKLTSALVGGTPAAIEAAERSVAAAHVLYSLALGKRTTMMKRGFGDLTLRQVCAYAPGPLRRTVYATLHDMTTNGIALRITNNNNKALILAGMERLKKTISVIQKSLSEQPGTYKRRGIVPPPSGSVLVSRRA